MLVWNLQDFAKVNLAYDCEKVPMSLQKPHVTERVELELPITFPLKEEYEKLNGTLDGLNTISDRDGRPDVEDMIEDERGDDDEDDHREDSPGPLWDDDDDDDDEDGRPPPGGASGGKDDKSGLRDHHPVHHTYGAAGDGIIYHNDSGQWVKMDRLGRPYRVDKRDGRRIVTPEQWKSLGHEHRKALAEEFKEAGIGTSDDEGEKEKDGHEEDKRSKKKKKRKIC